MKLEITEPKVFYSYPIAIGDGYSDSKYYASLTFQPIAIEGQTIANFTDGELEILQGLKGLANFGVDAIANLANLDYGQEVPAPADNAADLSLQPIKNKSVGGQMKDYGAILYMPMSIQQMESVVAGPESLGQLGGSISSIVGGGSATLGGIAQGAAGAVLDGFGSFLTNSASKEAGSVIANKIASKANSQVAAGVQNATRLQVSPNTRALFKQVNHREWNFSFQLIPTSADESEMIENIIDFFRLEQLPTELAGGGVSIAYRFPNLIQIFARYFVNDDKNPGKEATNIITKFLPSYLQSVDVTYNTNGMSFYDGGKFHDATLNLKFVEYRPLNKQDIAAEREYLNRTWAHGGHSHAEGQGYD